MDRWLKRPAAIRRLTDKRRNVEGTLRRRDVVERYFSHGSRAACARSRTGRIPVGTLARQREELVTEHLRRYGLCFSGLLLLESTLPASVTEPCIDFPKRRTSKGFVKRADRQDLELMKTHQALKEKRVKVEERKPLRFLCKIEKPAPRPPTPVFLGPPEGAEEKDLAVICLQKLFRGSSSMEAVFEGKEKRMELIQELRTTHALQQEEQEMQEAEKQGTLALQRERELHHHKALAVEALQAGVAGAVMADTLDFLWKELVRLQEERRIHAFTLLAERDRRMREAQESGRRQEEERRRREEDEIFRQVVQVHQATVELYLEDVILRAMERTADEQAREEIHRMAGQINDIAYAMEDNRTGLQSEEIVAELVYSFLIPEVQKSAVRSRVKTSQQGHILAARHIIHGALESVTAPPAGVPEAHAPPQGPVVTPAGDSQPQGEPDSVPEGGQQRQEEEQCEGGDGGEEEESGGGEGCKKEERKGGEGGQKEEREARVGE
ncbi:hypothetical protein AAFF_G00132870 [Aldrovandia affinis]|uniref:Uncharacterized protein n=1 Tax=Aldrovandia affinis TaxID=143900 RepID=A0AAD7W9L5_9TELE|nr:hypothetical protein AAFF_G00132870 [Aldrovandia affinis]